MKHTIIPAALSALTAALMSSASTAQTVNELGSPVQARAQASADYGQLVEAAYPRYEAATLKARFQGIAQKHSQGVPALKLSTLADVEREFALPRRTRTTDETRVIAEKLAYAVGPAASRIRLQDNREAVRPIARTAAITLLPQVKQFHADTLTRIGVQQDQLLFQQTDLLFAGATTDPQKGTPQKVDPSVQAFATYAIRAIDGIMVEGHSVKLVSRGVRKIEAMDARWPRLDLVPQMRTSDLKTTEEVKAALVARVQQLAKGKKASVRMAVVLRPVTVNRQRFYAPALKVGLRLEDEGEGLLFYENLLAQPIQADEDAADPGSGGAASEPVHPGASATGVTEPQ